MTNVDYVGFFSLSVASLFRQVDLYFKSRLVSSSNDAYTYRAIFETLLSYNNELQSGLFSKTILEN